MSVNLLRRFEHPGGKAVDRDARRVGAALIWALVIGSGLAAACAPQHRTEAVLWGGALALAGMLLGFLFGIPRFLRSGATPAQLDGTDAGDDGSDAGSDSDNDKGDKQDGSEPPPGAAPAAVNTGGAANPVPPDSPAAPPKPPSPPRPRPQPPDGVNTNLEEISDWLTKIIVGVSLVEVNKARAILQAGAGYIGEALGGTPAASSVAYAILIYFSVAGFLGSYLLTRLFLQQAFRDAAQR